MTTRDANNRRVNLGMELTGQHMRLDRVQKIQDLRSVRNYKCDRTGKRYAQ